MPMTFTSANCPNCKTYYDRVELAGDEDDVYAVIEAMPCSDCGTMLCACCDQFSCHGCADTFCIEHKTEVLDGEEMLACCPTCAKEMEEQMAAPELPARIGPGHATEPGVAVPMVAREEMEIAATCPQCASDAILVRGYDFGMDTETGYTDAGESFVCADCGASGPVEEVLIAKIVTKVPELEYSTADHWDGQQWVPVPLVWDGTRYRVVDSAEVRKTA